MRLLKLITLFGIAAGTVSTNAQAEDIYAERGKVYRNCKVISKDKHGVTFRHARGVAKVAYTSMPSAQRSAYGYSSPNAQRQAVNSKVHVTAPQSQRSSGTTFFVRNGNRYVAGYGSGFKTGHSNVRGHRQLYVRNRYNANSLSSLMRYRNNGYSNISFADQLYNRHFKNHAGSHYRGGRNAIVNYAPRYLPYVRNINPRQIGTFASGPSGGSLVPSIRSGYSTAGSIAPSLVSARR